MDFTKIKRIAAGILSAVTLCGVITSANYNSFENNVASGKGKMTYPNGTVYTGTFVEGKQTDTNATITFSNGSIYTGNVENGVMTGSGSLKYENGDIAKGTFTDGVIQGNGVYTLNGDSVYGETDDGKFFKLNHGDNNVVFKDGKVVSVR